MKLRGGKRKSHQLRLRTFRTQRTQLLSLLSPHGAFLGEIGEALERARNDQN